MGMDLQLVVFWLFVGILNFVVLELSSNQTPLNIMNTSPITPYDSDDLLSRKYHICDNTLVYCCQNMVLQRYSTVEYTFDQ
jgi:hypothetical protein